MENKLNHNNRMQCVLYFHSATPKIIPSQEFPQKEQTIKINQRVCWNSRRELKKKIKIHLIIGFYFFFSPHILLRFSFSRTMNNMQCAIAMCGWELLDDAVGITCSCEYDGESSTESELAYGRMRRWIGREELKSDDFILTADCTDNGGRLGHLYRGETLSRYRHPLKLFAEQRNAVTIHRRHIRHCHIDLIIEWQCYRLITTEWGNGIRKLLVGIGECDIRRVIDNAEISGFQGILRLHHRR